MSLNVACPNCQTRYNLPEKFAGKKVKCKSCGKPFSASVGANRAAGAQVNQTAQAPRVSPVELSKMGIGEIRQQPDPFAAPALAGPDPLRNHVVQDPGFGMPGVPGMAPGTHGQTHGNSADVDPDLAAVTSNPYIKAAKPVRETRKRASGDKQTNSNREPTSWYKQPWFILTAVFVPLFLLSIVLSVTGILGAELAKNVAMINIFLFGITNTVIGFWGLLLVQKSGSGMHVLLCIFVPLYIFIYIFQNWKAMKDYAYAIIAGTLLTPLGVVMVAVAMLWLASEEIGNIDLPEEL